MNLLTRESDGLQGEGNPVAEQVLCATNPQSEKAKTSSIRGLSSSLSHIDHEFREIPFLRTVGGVINSDWIEVKITLRRVQKLLWKENEVTATADDEMRY